MEHEENCMAQSTALGPSEPLESHISLKGRWGKSTLRLLRGKDSIY